MKKILKQLILMSLSYFIILLMIPVTSLAETAADISVGSYDDLLGAINAAPANGTAYVIEITDNITLTSQLTVPSGKNITITSDMSQSGAPFTLTQTATTTQIVNGARHFSLNTGATLTLENIILSGIGATSNYNGGMYLGTNANLIINDGAIIKNCRGGAHGGGVYSNQGTLTINGGAISGNIASENGGGVYMNFGNLTMNGGAISNNKALASISGGTTYGGGVYCILSPFTMTAGEISGNEAISSGTGVKAYGGGIVLNFSTFNMGTSGGSNDSVLIRNNTADYMGGGVMVTDSSFTMYCGTISGNKAQSGDELTYGGGVELYRGSRFTMKDGIISGNTANDFSGGVEVYDGSMFTMDGGSIINNTAPRGGGVSVGYRSAVFNMNGGVIGGAGAGNTATDVGGGAYVYSDGIITVASGTISGNSAPYGGGIFTDDTGMVTANNCTLADNAATAGDSGGGGIYTADASYANLATGSSTVFDGNSAATSYTPAGDLDAEYPNIRYASVTAPFTHPLNNYDINTTFNIGLECHITFDSQGGTGIPDQFKGFGETVDEPADPVKAGYRFLGWWVKNANDEWDHEWDFDTVLELETHGTELILYAQWSRDTGDGETTTLTYNPNGGEGTVYSLQLSSGSSHIILDVDDVNLGYTRKGYTFAGWNTADDGGGVAYAVGDTITITGDTQLYAQWHAISSLDTENHFAYILGYPDGTIRPEYNITRAEAATIFFRLLNQENREIMWSITNGYTDVESGSWYNNAISTLTNGGILKGYPDASFAPDRSITRAEFASVTVRLASGTEPDVSNTAFSDIAGHWAESDINFAAKLGYVTGYGDGTFRPDSPITRAEVITLLNKILIRYVEADEDMLPDMVTWPDNSSEKWYYFAIQEASNSHFYKRKTDGLYEVWTELRAVPDWTALETPNAAPSDFSY